MKKGYKHIVELEYLDDLILPSNNKLIIAILLQTVESLSTDPRYLGKFEFEVIKYGFQGYYPVIGVKSLSNFDEFNEDEIISYFNENIISLPMKNFIDFTTRNENKITKIFKEFEVDKV